MGAQNEAMAGNIVSSNSSSVSSDNRRLCREGAVFARVDHMFGFSMFHQMFARNPVPFAAFPSGHVAWPTCLVLNLPVSKWKRLTMGGGYIMLVAWATMYTSHHYFADVVGAISVVQAVDWSMRKYVQSSSDADKPFEIFKNDRTEVEEGESTSEELSDLAQVKISLQYD